MHLGRIAAIFLIVIVTVIIIAVPIFLYIFLNDEYQAITEEFTPLGAIAVANLKFSRNYFKTLYKIEGNLVNSPLSAHLALSMTQLGAGGSTASQMTRALHLPADVTLAKTGFKQLADQLRSENSEGINLRIANRMYVKSGSNVKQDFTNTVRETFYSEPQSVDFVNPDTRNMINQWVEQQTNGKIRDIVKQGELDESTKLIVLSAVQFQGKWLLEFDTSLTKINDFFISENEIIKVETMKMEYKFLKYKDIDHLNAKLIELPYKGNNFSFVILLPNTVNGLSKLERRMQTTYLSQYINAAPLTELSLCLPKFKIETVIDLKEPLKKMGMVNMFDSNANFTHISSTSLQLSKIIQQTIIEVTEKGTEATAATHGEFTPFSGSTRTNSPPVIKIDHPFLFYLVHRTTESNHVVLYSGRVVKPEGY